MMPSIIDKEYQEILERFKADIMPEILGNLQALRINTTGALRSSLNMQLSKRDDYWEISFEMLASGKIIHKKDRFQQKASAKELAEWVKQKGIRYFKYVPGYENTNILPKDAAERIAWAIKKSTKKERFRVHTPAAYGIYAIDFNSFASWFYKPYFSRWSKGRVEIVDAYFSTTTEELAKEIAAAHTLVA
jgi:hypothetical protein